MEDYRYANEVIKDLRKLPSGDPEKDHVLLDRYTLETLNLCSELIPPEDHDDSIGTLLWELIEKWEKIEELWYA